MVRPTTGDRRPATGDRRPATGDRRPATGGGGGGGGGQDPYRAAVAADSPVAWFRYRAAGDVTGTTVVDASGGVPFDYATSADGVLTLKAGGPTGGLYGEWVATETPAGVAIAGLAGPGLSGYSIEFWTLLSGDEGGVPVVVGSVGSTDELLHASVAYDGADATIGNNWFGDNLTSAPIPASAGWHHLVVAWDDATDVRRIYFDGIQVASDTPAGSPAWDDVTRVLTESPVDIAEEAFYDYALPAAPSSCGSVPISRPRFTTVPAHPCGAYCARSRQAYPSDVAFTCSWLPVRAPPHNQSIVGGNGTSSRE